MPDQKRRAAAIETAALSARFHEHAENMMAWTWHWFPRLTPMARDKWWVGMFALSSPEVAMEIGGARWDEAADHFGEAVAVQLRECLFAPTRN